jgi:hypothetical protein
MISKRGHEFLQKIQDMNTKVIIGLLSKTYSTIPDVVALLQSIRWESFSFINYCRNRVLADAGGPVNRME